MTPSGSDTGRCMPPPPSPSSSVAPNGSGDGPAHRRLRRLAVAATVATFLLIGLGGLVRATGSGLGCTGWPKCTAEGWLPGIEYHALIEYSHRSMAFLDVVLIVVLAAVAARARRSIPRVAAVAWVAVGLVVFQAVLGGIVVHGDLAALLVSAHLGTAMVLVGTLVYATVASFVLPALPGPGRTATRRVGSTAAQRGGHPAPGLTHFAWVTAGGSLALILVGAAVRARNAGLVFPDWPLMDGSVLPNVASLEPALHVAHRVLALGVGVLVAVLAVRAGRIRPEAPAVARLAAVAAGLFLAQVLIGAAAVWSQLAPAAVVAHVTVSSLIWGVLVATAATSSLIDLAPGPTSRPPLEGPEPRSVRTPALEAPGS